MSGDLRDFLVRFGRKAERRLGCLFIQVLPDYKVGTKQAILAASYQGKSAADSLSGFEIARPVDIGDHPGLFGCHPSSSRVRGLGR